MICTESVAEEPASSIQAIAGTHSALGESPFWHPDQQSLYWVDIDGCAIRCVRPNGQIERWSTPTEPGCIAPTDNDELIVALRDGVYRFSPATNVFSLLAPAPFDTKRFRFNDGKCDAAGRFIAGSISEQKMHHDAQLFRLAPSPAGAPHPCQLVACAGDVMTANGLAFSPDSQTAYWADTRAHRIDAFDYDDTAGEFTNRRTFKQFESRESYSNPDSYPGRPDGAAVDRDGAYWCAMYEGAQILRIMPDGRVDRKLRVPAQCPTMVCFGGEDNRTLFITTASAGRSEDELATFPQSGLVFTTRVDVAGLPVNYFSDRLTSI